MLFREVTGPYEDELVPNSPAEIHLKEDLHFYSAPRYYNIVVNGTKKTVDGDRLTFEQTVSLAFPAPPTGENIVFTVAYRRGEANKQGTLLPGQSVKLKEGMIFNVTATDKS